MGQYLSATVQQAYFSTQGTRCQREEDREGQPPGVELTAVATRTRATATAVGSRRATPTPMPTAPPTTTMVVAPVSTPRPLGEPSPQAARPTRPTPTTTLGPPRPNISKRRLLNSKLFPTSIENTDSIPNSCKPSLSIDIFVQIKTKIGPKKKKKKKKKS